MSSNTTILVPKILAWNANPLNPIGAEYIIMEKAPGIQLFKIWDDITEADRLGLIKSLTQLENHLVAIRFLIYGSLYFRHSISKALERILLDSSMDPTCLFYVGPACSSAWTGGISSADTRSDINAGPYKWRRCFTCFMLTVTNNRAYSLKIRVKTGAEIYCSDLSPPNWRHKFSYFTVRYKIISLYSTPLRSCCQSWRNTLLC